MDFFWLIPHQLAGSSVPEDIEDLLIWKRHGIKAVVSLLEDHEFHVNIDEIKQAGFEILWVPVKDMTAPTLDKLLKIVEWIDEKIEENKPVVVHCYGGYGRTGTVLAAYLVYKGWEPFQAIEHVRSIRPGAVVTPYQVYSVLAFRDYLAKRKKNN
ncbi:MAG: protein-tyrosine phosphatase family protein [Candidatus Njordarchaeales archaeon]